MKNILTIAVIALTLAATSFDAEAAKRFGGGSNVGKQRAAPTQKEAVAPAAPAPTQAAPAPAKPAAATPPAPQGFMSKWGGLIAGLGIGALLGSMFGGNMGGLGMMLAVLLAGVVVFAVVRMIAARREPMAKPIEFAGAGGASAPVPSAPVSEAPAASPAGFQGIGSRVAGGEWRPAPVEAPAAEPVAIPGFDKEAFLRVAKTSFIRLQAANDARDLDDIRDYTTPEMFAEISMQASERGAEPQKTEVVSLEAQMVEAVVEGDFEIASVRFYGLIRENGAANPEPFDEVWHVRKSTKDRKATWLIAGIQQNG